MSSNNSRSVDNRNTDSKEYISDEEYDSDMYMNEEENDEELTDINAEDYHSDDSFVQDSDIDDDDDDDVYVPSEDEYSESECESVYDEKESKQILNDLNEGLNSMKRDANIYRRQQAENKLRHLYMNYAQMLERVIQVLFIQNNTKIKCRIIDACIVACDAENPPYMIISCQYKNKQHIYDVCLHTETTEKDLEDYKMLEHKRDKNSFKEFAMSMLDKNIQSRLHKNHDTRFGTLRNMIENATNLIISRMANSMNENLTLHATNHQ